MAQMIPIMMNPETRKASSHVGKILLVFGVLGVGIIAFIFLSKVFKPFKAIGDFFGNMFKGIGGFFGDALGGLGGFFSMFKPKTKKTIVVDPHGIDYGDAETLSEKRRVETAYWYGDTNEIVRREFRRYSVEVVRELNALKMMEGIPAEMADRISMVESAFRKVNKVFVRDIPEQFANVFDRKAEFLKGNLIGGIWDREEEIRVKKMAKRGTGRYLMGIEH